jgi:membrane protease YdiL (CAAX protease family)
MTTVNVLKGKGRALGIGFLAPVVTLTAFLIAEATIPSVLETVGATDISPASIDFLVDVLSHLFAILIALGYLAWWHGIDGGWRSLTNLDTPGRRDIVISVVGTGGLLILVAVFDFLSAALGIAMGPDPGHEVRLPVLFFGGLVTTALLQVPAEELLDRRVVLDRLAESFGLTSATLLSAAFFTLAHAFSYSDPRALIALPRVFLGGVLLGVVYVRTDNLLVPVLSHTGYNCTLDVLIQAGLHS